MTTANLQARRVLQDHVHTVPELRWSRLPPVDRESEPLITDAPFSYAELRDLDAALDHLRAATRAVDVAVRSTSAPAIETAYADLRASVDTHRETARRVLSARRARAPS
jgi:hypothetical protein